MGRMDLNIEKAQFVEKLGAFYKSDVVAYEDIVDVFYALEECSEWVYVTYASGGQKRFCINGMNNRGIFWEFAKFLHYFDDYMWLRPGEEKSE